MQILNPAQMQVYQEVELYQALFPLKPWAVAKKLEIISYLISTYINKNTLFIQYIKYLFISVVRVTICWYLEAQYYIRLKFDATIVPYTII